MKVLVTGGAGFIGSHVVDSLLGAGHSVTVLDNFSSGRASNLATAQELANKRNLDLKILHQDLTELERWSSVEAHDALIHLAAQTSVTASAILPSFDFAQNVSAVPTILQWAQRTRVKYLLYANTAGAYYGEASHYPTSETEAPRPRSPYGATKAFFEIYLSAFAATAYDSSQSTLQPLDPRYFTWASLRLANVYGPRQSTKGEAGIVPILFDKIMRRQTTTIFGDGNKTRDYIHVSDVASAFLLALTTMARRPLNLGYNVATGTETRDIDIVITLVDQLQKLLRAETKFSEIANFIESRPWRHGQIRPGELVRSSLDAGLLKRDLGWTAMVSLEAGLRDTLAAYLESW